MKVYFYVKKMNYSGKILFYSLMSNNTCLSALKYRPLKMRKRYVEY